MFAPIAPRRAADSILLPLRRRSSRFLAPVLLVVTLASAGCSSAADLEPVTVTKVVSATPRVTPGPATSRPTVTTPDAGTSTRDAGTQDPGTPSTGTTPEELPSQRSPSEETAATDSTAKNTETGTAKPTSSAAGLPTTNAPAASPDTPGPEGGRACATDAQYVDEDPTGLRSDVVTGWRSIEKAANADGVIVCLNDGKRSRAQQQAQYHEYEKQYGKEVADQLVLPPSKSAHVIGNAIDVQPQAAYQWLQATKGSLGFCRIYDNEPWHFEYDVQYLSQGCPARLPKPHR